MVWRLIRSAEGIAGMVDYMGKVIHMPNANTAKITISLPRDLVQLADELASERSTTRSGLVADLLRNEEEARVELLMAQGYRALRQENRDEAEEALGLTREIVLRDD